MLKEGQQNAPNYWTPYIWCEKSKNNLLRIRLQTLSKRVNYTINKHTIDKFKVVADKDMRKMSNIVENLIRRYVESMV